MLDPADWGVWPSSQLNQNNLTVDVHGASFFSTNVSACRVGDFVVPLTHVSSTLVRCTVSPSLRLSKGYAYVEVSMNGLDFTSDRITFTLHEPVKLEQVFQVCRQLFQLSKKQHQKIQGLPLEQLLKFTIIYDYYSPELEHLSVQPQVFQSKLSKFKIWSIGFLA